MPRKHLTVGRAANSLASGGVQRASSRATWRRTRWSSGRRSLPEKRTKQKAALVVYCLSSTQNNQTSATMRLSLFKALFNVNNAVFEGVEVKQSPDGVVSIFFDVRPYKRFSHICPHCGRVCPGYDRGPRGFGVLSILPARLCTYALRCRASVAPSMVSSQPLSHGPLSTPASLGTSICRLPGRPDTCLVLASLN